ncbi:hypothetical protein D3C81_1937460 [compost metagenome]
MSIHERGDALAQCLDLGRIGEIHRGYLHGSEYMGQSLEQHGPIHLVYFPRV